MQGGIKISSFPPLQGGIKEGKSDLRVLQSIFFLGNALTCPIAIANRQPFRLSLQPVEALNGTEQSLKVPQSGTFKDCSVSYDSACAVKWLLEPKLHQRMIRAYDQK